MAAYNPSADTHDPFVPFGSPEYMKALEGQPMGYSSGGGAVPTGLFGAMMNANPRIMAPQPSPSPITQLMGLFAHLLGGAF